MKRRWLKTKLRRVFVRRSQVKSKVDSPLDSGLRIQEEPKPVLQGGAGDEEPEVEEVEEVEVEEPEVEEEEPEVEEPVETVIEEEEASIPPPITIPPAPAPPAPAPAPFNPPPAASKSSVVHSATTTTLLPLLNKHSISIIDVYASWCGPCKQLTPILEEMTVKSGGMFHLLKINADEERPLVDALKVEGLPSVFAVSGGKIVKRFAGMPKSEEDMKAFMMSLVSGTVDPSDAELDELTKSLNRVASAGCLTFSEREKITDFIGKLYEQLRNESDEARETLGVLIKLIDNVVNNPRESKFRRVNLTNPKITQLVTNFSSAKGLLKLGGFKIDDLGESMNLSGDWIDLSRLILVRDRLQGTLRDEDNQALAGVRRKKEMEERERVKELVEEEEREREEEERREKKEKEKEKLRLKAFVVVKWRREGKKKVHTLEVSKDKSLKDLVEEIGGGEEERIICSNKRLTFTSGDMSKTLSDLDLWPGCNLVFTSTKSNVSSPSSLKTRAAANKKKKGSHTMQSTGIYSKDDNLKGELIDGGGGTVYEQEVTSDEEEEVKEGGEEEEDEEEGEGEVGEEEESEENED